METALSVARFRPQAPLVMVADSVRLYRSLALVRGISPLVVDAPDREWSPRFASHKLESGCLRTGLAQEDDLAVLLSASGATGDKADTLQTVRL